MLLLTGVAAPLAGFLFRRVAGGWDSAGKGPFAMLEAKANRVERRGEAPLDVEAETERQLADFVGSR